MHTGAKTTTTKTTSFSLHLINNKSNINEMPNATNDDDDLMDSDDDELVDEIIRDKVIIYIANCFPKMARNRSNLNTIPNHIKV
jgi:hypothetical protein